MRSFVTIPSASHIVAGVTFLLISAIHLSFLKSIRKQVDRSPQQSEESSSVVVVNVFPDDAAVSKDLCAFVARAAKEAIDARGVFYLAVAGGSLLDALAGLENHKDTVDFSKVILSFVNHKCIHPDSDEATTAKCKSTFAVNAGISIFVAPSRSPAENGDGSAEAEFYTKALKDAGIPHRHGFPVLDLIILGIGVDGHIGSCYPMGPAVEDSARAVTPSPKSGEPASITFTIETMNSAREIAVVAFGGSDMKKEAVKRALVRPPEQPRGTFPAQLLASPIFFLNADAASYL